MAVSLMCKDLVMEPLILTHTHICITLTQHEHGIENLKENGRQYTAQRAACLEAGPPSKGFHLCNLLIITWSQLELLMIHNLPLMRAGLHKKNHESHHSLSNKLPLKSVFLCRNYRFLQQNHRSLHRLQCLLESIASP